MLAAVAQYQPPSNAPGPYGAAPPMPASDRVRAAWQRRYETDYVFAFWTAFGWTLLTCGIYGFYVLYQQVRRSRDHNRRRIELLDAAMTFAWEQAHEQGQTEQVRPAFERMAPQMAVLRQQATEFRDPALWLLIDIVTGGIARYVAYVFLDMDLVTHDHAEGAIEAELSQVYAELGTPLTPPDPGRLKGRHNYVGRIIATIASCGIYGLFWLYDLMVEGNRHFEHNWRWEDSLAAAVQSQLGVTPASELSPPTPPPPVAPPAPAPPYEPPAPRDTAPPPPESPPPETPPPAPPSGPPPFES
jgi:hypothetical protein